MKLKDNNKIMVSSHKLL